MREEQAQGLRHINAVRPGTWEYAAAGLGLVGLGAMAVQFATSGRFRIVSAHLGIDKIMAFHTCSRLSLGATGGRSAGSAI